MSGSFRCQHCCWLIFYFYFFYCQMSTLKRTMFAIRIPAFWETEGVNYYKPYYRTESMCVYLEKIGHLLIFRQCVVIVFTHLRVWRCAESMVVLHVKVNVCFMRWPFYRCSYFLISGTRFSAQKPWVHYLVLKKYLPQTTGRCLFVFSFNPLCWWTKQYCYSEA